MPTGKGAFGPVIVVPATPDPDHEVAEASLRILMSLFQGLEDTCRALDDGTGELEARIAADAYREQMHQSRRGERRPRF